MGRAFVIICVFLLVIGFASAALAPRTTTTRTPITIAPPPPPDADSDGTPDERDNCPSIANRDQQDSDAMTTAADGYGDACDNCPYEFNADQEDGDGDKVGDSCDNCPSATNRDQADADDDGTGDACEPVLGEPPKQDTQGYADIEPAAPVIKLSDADKDGIFDVDDNCETTPNKDQLDADKDGFGDACDTCRYKYNTDQFDDPDNDKLGEQCDNCPEVYNPDQKDSDSKCAGQSQKPGQQSWTCQKVYDGAGDACDVCPSLFDADQKDTDEDGIGDACDGCPKKANANQSDSDYLCVTDVDGNCGKKTYDGKQDACDNCPATYNPDQKDTDWDGIGDSCDNCKEKKNPNQADWDGDGLGNACDPCPLGKVDSDGDGISNECDMCPKDKSNGCVPCTTGITQWGDDPPSYWDWRYMGGKSVITSVKDQGACGSCYAQSSMGAIESRYNIETGKSGNSLDLSEQSFVSQCYEGVGSCFGGYASQVLKRAKTEGVPDEACMQYTSGNCVHGDPDPQNASKEILDCNFWCEDGKNASICASPVACDRCADAQSRSWKIESYSKMDLNDRDLKVAVLCKGPLVVCSDSWWHCVDLVGYDDHNQHWIIKNSWGYGWEDGGFGYIPYTGDKRLDFKEEVYTLYGVKKVQ